MTGRGDQNSDQKIQLRIRSLTIKYLTTVNPCARYTSLGEDVLVPSITHIQTISHTYLRDDHGDGGVDNVTDGREEDKRVQLMQREYIHERSSGRA